MIPQQLRNRETHRQNRGLIVLIGLILLSVFGFGPLASSLPAQDHKQMEEMSRRMQDLSRRIEACGSDIKCIERLAQEGKQMMQQAPGPNPVKMDPTATHVPCMVTIRQRTDFVAMSDPGGNRCASGGMADQEYTYEYEAREEGFLEYHKNFSRFRLEAPGKSLYSFDRPSHIRVLKSSGYRQTVDDTEYGCRVKKYPDGEMLNINSTHKTFALSFDYPSITKNGPNINFGPIAILVRNADTSCPGCAETSYDPGAFNPGRLQGIQYNPNQFKVSPADMKAALKAGRFKRTFRWSEKFDNHGSSRRDVLTVTIDFKKQPGKLAVSPAEPFKSAGPTKKGKFAPPTKTYTLSNTGGSPITFNVGKGKKWLKLSKTSGTLAPGAKTQVTVSVASSAKKLKDGTHKDLIKFTNATNSRGNTKRNAILDVGEIQVWDVKLTGQETDDMGGKQMYAKMNDVWKTVTVNYGVRFDYKIKARFVIKKEKGVWKYKAGTILSADVKYSSNFDPTVFYTKKFKCLNCKDVPNMAGQSINGSVSGKTVRLYWPHVVTRVIVPNKLKLKFTSKQKVHQGYSENFFESGEFLDRAKKQNVPLKNGEKVFKVKKESYKDKTKLDKRPLIHMYYRYWMKRIE